MSHYRFVVPAILVFAAMVPATAHTQDPANPVAISIQCNMTAGQATCSSQAAVPAGKRLVIDHVSAKLHAPAGQLIQLYVSISSPNLPGGTIGARHYIVFTPTASGTNYYASQPLKMYGTTAAPISVHAQRVVYSSGAPGAVDIDIYFTGHLLP